MKKTAYQLYMREIENIAPLSREDEIKHFVNWKENGDVKSQNAIYVSNLRFVVTLSHHYKNKGVDILDLINEGNVGLSVAMDRFDYKRGIKFISFAVWNIKQAMLELIANQSRFVSITGTEGVIKQNLNKAGIKLMQQLHREPTEQELADETGLSIEKVRHMERMLKYESAQSLDAPNLHGYRTITLKDTIKDDKFRSPDKAVNKTKILLKSFDEAGLDERQKHVIKAVYGIEQEPKNLQELAFDYNMSRERMRQIKEEALEALRAFSRKSKKLNAPHAFDEIM